MASDGLTPSSRDFLESCKAKVCISIVGASVALVFLGFCSDAGGTSAAAQTGYKAPDSTNYRTANYSQSAQIASYAFAAFCYIIASIVMAYGAFFISPFVTGTLIEKATLKSPKEIETV